MAASSPRIYIVIATFLPFVGGTEKQALAHGRVLRERGYEATIVTFRYSSTWPQREVMEGVPVIRVAALLLRKPREATEASSKTRLPVGYACYGLDAVETSPIL